MKYILFVTALVGFLLCGCKEENSKNWREFHISVTHFKTGLPVDGITCEVLSHRDFNNAFTTEKAKIIAVGETVNGHYSYGIKSKNSLTYWARAKIDENSYYVIDHSTAPTYSSKDGINEWRYELAPYGYLALDIDNANCFNENDSLVLIRKSETGYNAFNYPTKLMGCYSSSPDTYGKIPSGEWYFEWQVTKNGITSMHYDTLYLPANESLIYSIQY